MLATSFLSRTTVKQSLGEFACQMKAKSRNGLTVELVSELVERLDLDDLHLDAYSQFTPEAYAYQQLLRTPLFEMIHFNWEPGQSSTVHNHSNDKAVIRVIEGEMLHRIYELQPYRLTGQLLPVQVEEQHLNANQVASVDSKQIHQLLASTRSRTLHVYTRPLNEIVVFDLLSGGSSNVGFRYTLR